MFTLILALFWSPPTPAERQQQCHDTMPWIDSMYWSFCSENSYLLWLEMVDGISETETKPQIFMLLQNPLNN